MSTPNLRPSPSASQRRSQRILLSVRIQVSGKRATGESFSENATTLVVNAHGALLLLHEIVSESQLLHVQNISTGESVACRVVDINSGANGSSEVGVEFSQPAPRFWRVSFPPADWTTKSPEAKRFESAPPQSPKSGKVFAEKK